MKSPTNPMEVQQPATPDASSSQHLLILFAIVGSLVLVIIAGFITRGASGGRDKGGMMRVRADDDLSDDDGAAEPDDVEETQSRKRSPRRRPVGSLPRGESLKGYVEIGNTVYPVDLPCRTVDSWAALSQHIHEVCEANGVPNLPIHGTMHIVLNVEDQAVPVTGGLELDVLQQAIALRVTIT